MAQKSVQEIQNALYNDGCVTCSQTISAAGATVVWTPAPGRTIYLTNAILSSVSATSLYQLYGGGAKITGSIFMGASGFNTLTFPVPLKLSANCTLGVSSDTTAKTVGVVFVGYEV